MLDAPGHNVENCPDGFRARRVYFVESTLSDHGRLSLGLGFRVCKVRF